MAKTAHRAEIKTRCRFCRCKVDTAFQAVHPPNEAARIPARDVFQVHCFECGANGPYADTLEGAILAWEVRGNLKLLMRCKYRTPENQKLMARHLEADRG